MIAEWSKGLNRCMVYEKYHCTTQKTHVKEEGGNEEKKRLKFEHLGPATRFTARRKAHR